MENLQEVWFHENGRTHKGFLKKVNQNTVSVLVEDKNKPNGYQLWRVEPFFLEDSSEAALKKWNDYRKRLNIFKSVMRERRKSNEFFRGLSVLVEPINKPPYKGMIIRVCRITLDIVTQDGRFMKVDKAICKPIYEVIF